MGDTDDQYEGLRTRRNRLVQEMTDLNERQLKVDNESAGIDFELMACEEAIEDKGATPDLAAARDDLQRRRIAVEEKKQTHEAEGERLLEELRRINTKMNDLK